LALSDLLARATQACIHPIRIQIFNWIGFQFIYKKGKEEGKKAAMQAPTAELALQDWARENNIFDLLPVITEHGYLSVESLSHIDKQYALP